MTDTVRKIAEACASQIADNWGDEDRRANKPDVRAIEAAIDEALTAHVAALTAAREALDNTRENCEDFDIQPCWCPEDWRHIGHCPYCVKNCKALAAIDAVLTPKGDGYHNAEGPR